MRRHREQRPGGGERQSVDLGEQAEGLFSRSEALELGVVRRHEPVQRPEAPTPPLTAALRGEASDQKLVEEETQEEEASLLSVGVQSSSTEPRCPGNASDLSKHPHTEQTAAVLTVQMAGAQDEAAASLGTPQQHLVSVREVDARVPSEPSSVREEGAVDSTALIEVHVTEEEYLQTGAHPGSSGLAVHHLLSEIQSHPEYTPTYIKEGPPPFPVATPSAPAGSPRQAVETTTESSAPKSERNDSPDTANVEDRVVTIVCSNTGEKAPKASRGLVKMSQRKEKYEEGDELTDPTQPHRRAEEREAYAEARRTGTATREGSCEDGRGFSRLQRKKGLTLESESVGDGDGTARRTEGYESVQKLRDSGESEEREEEEDEETSPTSDARSEEGNEEEAKHLPQRRPVCMLLK